jgi:uncharacterized membrane protein HdeD (DUF308 family)
MGRDEVLAGTVPFRVRSWPTRATGWALRVIGSYVVFANLADGVGVRGLRPSRGSQLYFLAGVVTILIGLAVVGQVQV